jgi:hypothetical protein
MSTTFHIIPTIVDNDLTFKNVLTLAKQTLESQLKRLSLNLTINLSASVHDNNEAYVNNSNPNAKFIWADNEYVWFAIDNLTGGTDAHCEKIADKLSDWETYIEDMLHNISATPEVRQKIIDCEYEWYFRRSAGQPAIINLAYGHLAAAVAKLTQGYIYSDDGAWHDTIFPATADQFLEVYFYPDRTKDPADIDWITGCLEELKDEFASR